MKVSWLPLVGERSDLINNCGSGAGYLRKIGNKVNRSPMNLQEGDPVLLSIAFCNACPSCRSGHPAYCQSALKLNFAHPGRGTYTMADGKDKNTTVVGGFFGQSSLGSLAIVDTSCIVNLAGTVKSRDELKMFAPLGCGFQTGAGTVMNLGKACPSDSVTIIGIGGVGLAGVMVSDHSTYSSRILPLKLNNIGCQNHRLPKDYCDR